jgi:hypothetical protein
MFSVDDLQSLTSTASIPSAIPIQEAERLPEKPEKAMIDKFKEISNEIQEFTDESKFKATEASNKIQGKTLIELL